MSTLQRPKYWEGLRGGDRLGEFPRWCRVDRNADYTRRRQGGSELLERRDFEQVHRDSEDPLEFRITSGSAKRNGISPSRTTVAMAGHSGGMS